jgi:hypothetical protein
MSITSRAFCGDPRKNFALALASMIFHPPANAGGSDYALGAAGAGALPPAGATFVVFSAFSAFVPEWPLNVRVGANSPSLCPTMFSVT